jgi:hypothetical protein
VIRSCVVLALFLASGCAPFMEAYLPYSSVLSKDYLGQPLAAEDVNVFLASDIIPDDCRRVALLRAAPTRTVVDVLRAEAGRLGANAVDLRDYRTTGASQPGQAGGHWPGQAGGHWDAVALYCPTGGG